MILRLEKVLRKDIDQTENPVAVKYDFLDSIEKISEQQLGFTAHFKNGKETSFCKGSSPTFDNTGSIYSYSKAILLNDKGEFLEQLF